MYSLAKQTTEFHSLRLPYSDGGGGNQDWCTCDKDTMGMWYLLNDGSNTLGDLMDGLKVREFYFNTEEEAYKALYQYYAHHGVPYPYIDEWLDLVGLNSDRDAIDEEGSQVMVFR